MVTLRKAKDSDKPDAFQLKVNENQGRFVGNISELWNCTPDTMHSHIILDGKIIVGFFNIDTKYSENYTFTNKNELGLRSFFIDTQKQGNGFGRSAAQALKPYLRIKYDSYSSIALTVNCQNPHAYKAYIKGGFVDTGDLYHGGHAGPQHILRMQLNNE